MRLPWYCVFKVIIRTQGAGVSKPCVNPVIKPRVLEFKIIIDAQAHGLYSLSTFNLVNVKVKVLKTLIRECKRYLASGYGELDFTKN